MRLIYRCKARTRGVLYKAIRTTFNDSMDEYCASRNIHWSFIPSHAPYMGGLWEAGIKSCKYHLRRVIETMLTFEELSIILVQIGVLKFETIVSCHQVQMNYNL